jgi:hypothetical protein
MRATFRHVTFEMVVARVCAIMCSHEDVIDLDRQRHDPPMKVAVGRRPQSGAPLASRSTISRLGECAAKDGGGAAPAGLVDQARATIRPREREILDPACRAPATNRP